MHECSSCGMACDCDGEDLWHDYDTPEARNCLCDCEDYDFEGEDDEEDEI